jgi:valyl-tRNA synthetase
LACALIFESIDILNDDGTLSEKAGLYIGQDRFEVRDQIAKDLQAAGQMPRWKIIPTK